MAFSLRMRMVFCATLAVALLAATGCKKVIPTDTRPLDQSGLWYRSIEELRQMEITDAEVAELVKVRQAGVSDASCIELVRIARSRKLAFADGASVLNLRSAAVSEPTVIELARLDQLGAWAGEAQLLRLAGFTDDTLLAVARRRAAGQPVPSSASLAELKNAGMGEPQIRQLVERGATEQEVREMLAAHQRSTEHSQFVRSPRRRR